MFCRWLFVSLSALGVLACSAGEGGAGPSQGGASGGSAGATTGGAGGGGASSGGASGSAGTGGATGGSAPGGAGGAAGSSAGAAGSAGTGGSGGSAAPPLFFDDFESGSVDTARWTERINGTATFTVDGTQKHGGTSALHLNSSAFSAFLAAEGAPLFPAPDNTFYGRVWLYVPGELPGGAHVVWIEAGDVDNDQHEVRIGMNLGAFQVNLWQGGEVDLRAPDAPLMANTWHCVEFKMGNDELEVWLDEQRIDDLSTTNWVASDPQNGNTSPKSAWSPTYEAVRIGWELAGDEIFYDDVAFDHARIYCQ